jgi:hypothetical protein
MSLEKKNTAAGCRDVAIGVLVFLAFVLLVIRCHGGGVV